MQEGGMLAAEGCEQQLNNPMDSQKEILNILGRLALDEATKLRWDQLQTVLKGLFDVGRPLQSWFDQNAFITSYTCTNPQQYQY
jgi:hypothetical protein